jgi:hypothetical protein
LDKTVKLYFWSWQTNLVFFLLWWQNINFWFVYWTCKRKIISSCWFIFFFSLDELEFKLPKSFFFFSLIEMLGYVCEIEIIILDSSCFSIEISFLVCLLNP